MCIDLSFIYICSQLTYISLLFIGQIAVEDMDGGTFTISNGGIFGSLMGTPIINPPQSAILGMHGIFERPIALKGQVNIIWAVC